VRLGFDVNLVTGLFKVHITRWEALRDDAAAILNSKGTRVQAHKLVRLVGTIISMKLAWGPSPSYIRGTYIIYSKMIPLSIVGSTSMTKSTASYSFGKTFLAFDSNQKCGLARKGYATRLLLMPVILVGEIIHWEAPHTLPMSNFSSGRLSNSLHIVIFGVLFDVFNPLLRYVKANWWLFKSMPRTFLIL